MLEIKIIGTVGSGKSTLAHIIAKLLCIFDIETVIIDDHNDYDAETSKININKILAMKSMTRNEIIIRTVQVNRESL